MFGSSECVGIKKQQLRTGSSGPFASCHRPTRSACNASMVLACGTCSLCIPYAGRFSWWSWPKTHKRENSRDESHVLQSHFELDSHLLSEDWLSLATESLLFPVVTTTTLSSMSLLRLLVLRHLVDLMRVAFAAVRATLLWNIHLKRLTMNNEIHNISVNFNLEQYLCEIIHLICVNRQTDMLSACRRDLWMRSARKIST